MRFRNSKGYTIIEALVAMAVFTSMVALATMALNQGLRQYHGLMERGINFWQNARSLWINRSFGSALDYYVKKDKKNWFPYFYGTQDRISYVSLSPVANDVPVVVWIVKERQDNGRFAMVYYEIPVYTKTLEEIERAYAFGDYKKGHAVKFLEDAEGVEIGYYGYDLLKRKSEWTKDFDASAKIALPSLIRLDYTSDNRRNTLIYAVNTNSLRKTAYNETY